MSGSHLFNLLEDVVVDVLILETRREPRQRMARLLAGAPGVRCVGPSASSAELLAHFHASPANVVFLSTRLQSDLLLETVRALMTSRADAEILVFGPPESAELAANAIQEGAQGFLSCEPGSVGGLALGGSSNSLLVPVPRAAEGQDISLSGRELEVLRGMSSGKTNGEIGGDLHLSEDTIKTHAQRLFRKLSANDRAHAVVQGLRRNLID
ncbi:LuxR C-terminal-related transcriptional regulator [Amycolatopsis sp. cmx-11-32]|uniref:response regulator transcription factor n=1 Tax=Amycolatopsis sp. cmx-11-32 TaxID=2785796 RepID=UPI0039E4BA20